MDWFFDKVVDSPWWGLLLGLMTGINFTLALTPPHGWIDAASWAAAICSGWVFTFRWLPTYVSRRIRERDRTDWSSF